MKTAHQTVSQAHYLKAMTIDAAVAINGTYFAAYNNAIPFPDGTLMIDGKLLQLSDIGTTIGITTVSDAFVIYTPEYGLTIPIPSGKTAIVCTSGYVNHFR